ncbi:MAG: lysylphosphatidylglycerol synthase transmembrane domain-containing protein [Nitrospinaceae bacterium]
MKKYQQFILGLVIASIALYYSLRNVAFEEVISSFKEMDYIYILPSVVIIILSYVFRAYRWQALLQSSLKVNVSGLFSPMMVGFMGNFLPARAAEILRPYLLSKKYPITFSTAFASIVMERLFDMIMLLLIFIWVFWFQADIFSSDIKFSGLSIQKMAITFGEIGLFCVIFLLVFIYVLIKRKKNLMELVNWFTSFMNKKWSHRIINLIEEFSVGCDVVKNFGTLVKVSIYSMLIWIGNILYVYPLYFAFGLENKTITSLLILAVMVSILITVVPTPGFLGSYNAGVLIALHEIMGESEIKSVGLGMVGWALGSGVVIIGGLCFIFYDQMSFKTLIRASKQNDATKGELL